MSNGNMLVNFVSRIVSFTMIKDVTAIRIGFVTFGLHTAIILAALFLIGDLPSREAAGFINPSAAGAPPLVEKFIKWDAHWYTYIAEHGYNLQSIVFFPLILLLIKLLAGFGLSYVTAGFILCNLFTFISFYLMAKTFLLNFPEIEVKKALIAYALLPTSFFLNSVYTESIFIVFALASLYCLRTRSWWSAGLFAALTALCRNLGILLVPVILWECIVYYRQKRKVTINMIAVLLPLIALSGFCLYNYLLFADPLAFVHSQQAWGRRFGLPWDNFWNNVNLVVAGVPSLEVGVYLDAVLVALAFIALLAVTVIPAFRLPWTYTLLGWFWFFVPMFSTSPIYPLYSMARFVLVILPVYLFLAKLPDAVFYCLITMSAVGLLVCTGLFINWAWLG
ncbi:hypothetical protein SPACI_015570 [Sporomusa acidovorans DSM 3132]|uniref:Mannosyltransferase (PIG-V) n=2 Tax=Sporomusa TaxID=2375 RepID=A0ABZ3IZN2_SPOA4|nr:mannosyltransferase [Sporomusa acidovorans DSM 3132]SDF35094.1 Mannosyltransferase (PIG-V) [Sporomusa acidovorans]